MVDEATDQTDCDENLLSALISMRTTVNKNTQRMHFTIGLWYGNARNR